MTRLAVVNAVGLCGAVIGHNATPRIASYCRQTQRRMIRPAFPAVTCTAQSNYLTGERPESHGIVANGWYHRELAEVQFWKQSNALVRGEKIWETMRRRKKGFTCAKLFWWYNMHSTADFSITPRPMYPADGRKIFDIYTFPYALRAEIKKGLGEFPFPTFWGPVAGRQSPQGAPDAASRWIAEAAKWIESRHRPDLSLIYLPHLDYNLQRLGPNHSEMRRDYRRLDAIVGDLLDFFDSAGVRVCLLSEYGIHSVKRPIHLNREFRKKGWLTIKEELGLEMLDCGQSRIFGIADHQVCHLYANDSSVLTEARRLLEKTEGIAAVLNQTGKQQAGVSHERSGDLIAVAEDDAWFTYYYWLDDKRAPDFARCVDIHRKPGYDPVELFLDSSIRFPRCKIAWRLLQKKLGLRMLLDVIPLNANLVRGSHGNRPKNVQQYPVFIGPDDGDDEEEKIDSIEVFNRLIQMMT